MPETLLFRGARIVDPATGRDEVGDVAVREGAVVPGTPGATVLACEGLVLAPGLVDLHTHLREPGREDKETVESGCRAAALGGYTAVMDAGELLQYGPTAEVFHRPQSLRVARAFSDPPMNLMAGDALADGVRLKAGPELAIRLPGAASKSLTRSLTIGVRASALRLLPRPGDAALPGKVELTEISGSDTFVHVETAVGELVAQLTGVNSFELGAPITLHLSPEQAYVFDAQGALLIAPARRN